MEKENSFNIKGMPTRRAFPRLVCLMGIVLGLFQFSYAQVPQKFNYQAVARDLSGNVLPSHLISIKISILNGGATGSASYIETHSVVTNQFGLFTLQVGSGTAVSGSMNIVPWSNGNQWMKIDMDVNGGTNYVSMGTTQLLSVPFALVAGSASNMKLNDLTNVDCTSAVTGQVLKYNGTNWIPGNDNGGTGTNSDYLPGTGISISGTNVITNTGDTDPSDDITNITNAGGDLSGIFPNPKVVSIQGKPVSSVTPNAGQVLKYDGTKWAPDIDNASSGGATYSAGTGISISGSNVISASSLAGDVNGLPGSNTVTKIQNIAVSNTFPSSGQVLKFNGTTWAPGNDNGGAGGSYTAGSGISISGGNVITADNLAGDVTGTIGSNVVTKLQTYDVSPNAPSVGQVMKWNGTQWAPGTDNTTGGSGSSLWNQVGSSIYNFNGGYVGVGNNSPTALLDVGGSSSLSCVLGQFKNTNASSTSNVINISNNGTGYSLYSYKTGQSEAAYFVKDNPGSGTANIYATNNGTGNTIDAFATGKGYAGGFYGGANAIGGIYANVTGAGYAGYFDGDISGNGIYSGVTGSGFAAYLKGKTKIQFDCITPSVPHINIYEATSTDYARINFQNSSGGAYWSAAGMTNNSASNARFNFEFNSTNVLAMTGDGNIGMGISVPAARLHLYSDANYSGTMVKLESNNPGNPNPIISISSMSGGELINASKTGIGYGINIQKTGTFSSTAAVYGATAGTNGEGIRGSAFGNGGYGIYGNAAGNGTNSYFGVYGYASGSAGSDYGIYGLQGQGANDWAGYFSGNVGYTGMLLSTSDEKLKENVTPYSGALKSILALQPKTYEYRHDGEYAHMKLPEGEQMGLIAQDIEKILPDLVKQSTFTYLDKKSNEDGKPSAVTTSQIDYKGVNYIGLIPVLVGAIQEQQKEIEDLKLQVSRLTKK